jgi:hypothetical protein
MPQMKKTDQILFAVYSVTSGGERCGFERLIKECFTLFPETFGFSKYPQWPDSLKLDRHLRTLRKRKLISGEPGTSFSLTKSGRLIALETSRTFRQRKLFK